MKTGRECPIVSTIGLVGKKWHLTTIRYLMDGPKRFNELKAVMNPMSSRTLSAVLSELREVGIVERVVQSESPISVSYRLTDKGSDLIRVLREMHRWGEKWADRPRERTSSVDSHG